MIDKEIESNFNSSRGDFLIKEITSWNNFIKEEQILKNKILDMTKSSYDFYRATCHIFYKDINMEIISIPLIWKQTPKIQTWIQGDLHTQNIGYFENSSDKIKLDINDFDESYIAPFYLDLIRFVISIFLVRESVKFNFSMKECNKLSEYYLEEYQETLQEISKEGKELELIEDNLDGFSRDTLEELKDKKSNSTLLSKWTTTSNGKLSFDFSNPDIIDPTEVEIREINSNWNSYLEDLKEFYEEKGHNFFQIQSIARRINSGMGGQGFKKYYVLIQGNSSPIILELKEQRLPSMIQLNEISESDYFSFFQNHAERAKTACKAMLANPDLFLGTMQTANCNYLVKRISPFKKKLEPIDFKSETDFKKFLKHSAQAIAYAHSRSYKSILINSTSLSFANTVLSAIKQWPSTRNTIVEMSASYAKQVESDFLLFKEWMNKDN